MTSLVTTPAQSPILTAPKRPMEPAFPTPITPTAKRPRSFWDTVLDGFSQADPIVSATLSPQAPFNLQHRPYPHIPSIEAAPHIPDLANVVSSPVSNFTDSSLQLNLPSPHSSPVRVSAPVPLSVSPSIRKTHNAAATNRPHICSACGSSFARSSHLRLHIRTIHEKLKPFQCEQCPAAFGHVSSKYRHFRTVHLKRRDFECDRCGQTFAERAAVLKHCRTVHEGSRPYPCPTCGFRFHFKLHLSQHISTVHEKQRPHQCMICNACFGQRSSLNRHSRQIHGVSTKK